MDTSNQFGRDGNVGLGVLALMTIAFISAEAQSDWRSQDVEFAQRNDTMETRLLIDMGRPVFDDDIENDISGAIRELSVVPVDIESRLNLDWSPDEVVIEEYRRAGF